MRAQVLDEDHYDLEKIKDRILEYLAVRRLKEDRQGDETGGPGTACRRQPRADPLLRRPAGRGQDLAGPLDRAGAGPRVRAHVAGRHSRRGGDSRPPAHLHRRDAGAHHPVYPPRGHERSRFHARRGGQGRRRLAWRSVVGAAGSARSGAEPHVPRQLPRPAVRPVEGLLHRHGQRARAHPRATARPHGGAASSPATPRSRSCTSPAATCCPSRSRRNGLARGRGHHDRRGARPASCATTRARPVCAAWSARSAASAARSPRRSPRASRDADRCHARARCARSWAAQRFFDEAAERIDRPGVVAGLW